MLFKQLFVVVFPFHPRSHPQQPLNFSYPQNSYASACHSQPCRSIAMPAAKTAISPSRHSKERFSTLSLPQKTPPLYLFRHPLSRSKRSLWHNLCTTLQSLHLPLSQYHHHHHSVHCTPLLAWLNLFKFLSCAVHLLGRHLADLQVHSSAPGEKGVKVRGRMVGV